ncbi:MAG TPA: hypothetical protein VKV26_10305 [Dehalococcoidia bacterium]|nr:hypothetical protein [Dehalococcoidia bacterium]
MAAMAAGCAVNPQAPRNEPGGTPAPAGSLPCLGGLRAYRFSGELKFNAGQGQARNQVGSLANLLQDVQFEGAHRAPAATQLQVSFPQGASQDVETIRIGGTQYQRVGGGAWETANGSAGPFVAALAGLDPQTLCEQTLGTVSTAGKAPVAETLNGVPAQHYSFAPGELARTPGLFGQGREGVNNQQSSTSLDVWTAGGNRYPLRIDVQNRDPADGSSFQLSLDVRDPNGGDIAIKAPR